MGSSVRLRFEKDDFRLGYEGVIVPCFPPTGEGECNPDKRLPGTSPNSRCVRLSCILLGTSGVILYGQLASDVLAGHLSTSKHAKTRTVVAKEK